MNAEKIKEFRDTYKGKKNINIFLDNSLMIYMGLPGQAVIWDDAKGTLVCIRPNQSQILQATSPYEIIITGYEHIQHMSVSGTTSDIKKYLDKVNYSKREELIKYLREQPVNVSSITAATGDKEYNDDRINEINGTH